VVTEGESRDFYIEVENSDFRNPPGCGEMFEPYRRVLRIGGMLNEEQQAQMRQAKQQFEQLEAQLAAGPADQREMVEGMLGSAMGMMRGMSDDGAIEYPEEIEEILCNPDLKALISPEVALAGGPIAGGDEVDIAQIQRYLVTLGYQPGNTTGELDTLTGIAIAQFQAEHGLPVTGEPSRQLAIRLAAEIQNQRTS
jgi:hypothetical protein